MSKKSTLMFVIALMVLIIGVSAVSAADVSTNDTSVATVEDTHITSHATTQAVVKEDNNIKTSDNKVTNTKKSVKSVKTNTDNIKTVKTNTDNNKTVKTTKNIKTATTHVVNQDNWNTVFVANGTNSSTNSHNYDLSDDVVAGDTIDFQGHLFVNGSLRFTKPVNVISSTKDANISLNTTAGSLFGENPGNSFWVGPGAANSTFSGIYLYNTQFWVTQTTNITFTNMSMVVSNQRVGSGVGQTAVRASTFITLRDCYIYTENNGGSSSFVITRSEYCTIDHCTIRGVGNVGNLLYLNIYNAPQGTTLNNSYNNITNNDVRGPLGSGISWSIVLSGQHNLVSGNTANGAITTAWGGTTANNTIVNNTVRNINGMVDGYVANNTAGSITTGLRSVIENNNVANLTASSSSIVRNNNITEKLTVSNAAVNVTNNTVNNIIVNNARAAGTNITANNVTGTVRLNNAKNVNVSDNLIVNEEDYTLTVTGTNNIIANNHLIAGTHAGMDTVTIANGNTVENNTPEAGSIYNITDETYNNFFDEKGVFNATSLINNYSTINLLGTFNNKNFTFKNVVLTIIGVNATLNNATIASMDESKLSINNITINNARNNNKAVILETDNNKVRNVNIKHVTKSTAQEIYVTGVNNKIENNSITVYAPSKGMNWAENPVVSNVAGIIILSGKNTVQNNIVNIIATTTTGVGTVEGITVQGSSSSTANNNVVKNNKVTVKATDYAYGINVGENANSNTIQSNNINMTSDNYAAGIQIGYGTAANNTLQSNTININAKSYAYGLLISVYGKADVSGTTMSSNTVTATADNVYLIETYSSTATSPVSGIVINNNNLNGNGNHTIGIAFVGKDSTITANTINVNGVSNSTVTGTYDMIAPTTAGILVQDSDNVTINHGNTNIVNGPAIKLINTNNSNIGRQTGTLKTNNTAVELIKANNNVVRGVDASTTSMYAVTVTNSANTSVNNNTLYSNNNLLGGDNAVNTVNGDNITVGDNSPILLVITNKTYSSIFDENGVYNYVAPNDKKVGVLVLGSDLQGVDLIFNNTFINLINAGNYTIYNGTLEYTGGEVGSVTVTGININNVDKKAVIVDINNETGARNTRINLLNMNINVTGDNVTAIESISKTNYYVTFEMFDSNITVTGKNATAVYFVGVPSSNPRWSPDGIVELERNNINIKADDTAKALVTITSNGDFKNNKVNIDGNNVIAIESNNGIFGWSSLQYNNITANGDNITVVSYTNDTTTDTKYINYNNITATSDNPVVAFNITNATRVDIEDNVILINAENEETPVISVAKGTNNQVTNNYIQAQDIAGDDAVEQTGITINNNQPVDGNYRVIINKDIPENTTINKYITIQANATDAYGNPVTGTITVTVDGEIIISQPFVSSITAYYVSEEAGRKVITVTYTDPNGVYATTSTTSNLNVLLNNAVITIGPINTTINKTTPITVTVTGENGRAVTNGTVEFTAYDTTVLGVANVTNGVATITITPTEIENTTIYAHYLGNELYNESTATATYFVNNIKSTITLENMTITSNATTVNVKLVGEYGNNVTDGTVTITVNGNTYQGNVTNGSASVTIPASSLKTGNNILSVNYTSPVGYEPATTTYYVNGTRYGSVYYVAVNGSSSNDGRTPETPWNYTYAFNTIRNSTYNNSLIYILNGTYNINDTVVLNNGLTLKIIGNNSPVLNENNKIINAFNIQNGLVSLESMIFRNFANTPILNRANNTNITGNTFLNNKGINGGAISNYNANNATILRNTFTNNTGMYGGAIYNRGNNTIINKNTFTKNNASISSGAIYNLGRNTWITNNIFTNNHANTLGGAINNWETTKTTITGNKFTGNQANYGGAIYYRGTGLKLNNNNMTSNTARVSGGAVFIIGNNNRILNNNFTANKARSGAAINNLGTNTNITGNIIKYNTANTTGAAVNNWNARNTTIANNTIHHNQAQYGAIYIRGANNTVQSNNIYSNKATISGGAIFNIGENTAIKDNTIKSNNAQNYGGAINNWNGVNTRITGNNITYNNATYGGAINTRGTNTYIVQNTIRSNTATRGGAVFNTAANTTTMNNNKINNNPTQNGTEVIPAKNIVTITTDDITVNRGNNITLTTKITNESNTSQKINTGIVVFKLNGVTLKDNNGNKISISVENGTATLEYNIPSDMGVKNYKITTVFLADNYYRGEIDSTLTVTE